MRIKHKLFLGFGLLLGIFLALSLYLSMQLTSVGQKTQIAAEYPLQAVDSSRAAWDIFRNSRQLVNQQLALVQFSDTEAKAKNLLIFQQQVNQELNQAQVAARALAITLDFNHIEKLIEQWYQKNLQRIGTQRTQNLVDERVLTKIDKDLAKELAKLVAISKSAAQKQKELMATSISRTQTLSIALIVGTLVLGGFIATVLFLSLSKPLELLMEAVSSLSRGDADLTQRLNLKRNDEIGDLSKELDIFIQRLHSLMTETKISVNAACQTLNSFAELTEHTRDGAESQRQSLQQTLDNISVISAGVSSVKTYADNAKEQGQQVSQETQQSLSLMEQAASNIQKLTDEVASARDNIQALSEDSNSISNLITVIESIADQTNLLALNAAIEAARAGDAGRGFAVVADEVRSLAMKTRESTENIQNTVCGIKEQVDGAREVMEGSRDLAANCVEQSDGVTTALNLISSNMQKIERMNLDIAEQTLQQSQGMHQAEKSMQQVNQVAVATQENAAALSERKEKLMQALLAVEKQIGQFTL